MIKDGHRITGFWNKTSPILGLLLLLSVCSLFSDSKYQATCQKNSDNGGNSYFKQATCISGSNSFPEGDGCVLNAVLSTHTEHGNGELLLSGIGGSPGKIFNLCQTQGNPFPFISLVFRPKLYEKGNVHKKLNQNRQ